MIDTPSLHALDHLRRRVGREGLDEGVLVGDYAALLTISTVLRTMIPLELTRGVARATHGFFDRGFGLLEHGVRCVARVGDDDCLLGCAGVGEGGEEGEEEEVECEAHVAGFGHVWIFDSVVCLWWNRAGFGCR